MLLFLASGLTDGKQNKVECTHSKLGFPILSENTSDDGAEATAPLPMTTENGLQQDAISRPEVSEASATLRFPSFVKMDVLETHGASMFQKRRTRALI